MNKWLKWLISQRRAWASLFSAVIVPVALSLGYTQVATYAGIIAGLLAGRSLMSPKKKNIWD